MLALDFLPPWLNTFSFVMLVALGIVLLFVALLSLRNPLIGRLGVRNIPRRPAQTALIVTGLTLSTVIIASALATGDTLDYSIQRHAVDAYGEIDEIVAAPLLAALVGLADDDDPFATAAAGPEGAEEAGAVATSLLADTPYEKVFTILRDGLPGIPTGRYQRLQAEALEEELIDGVAPAIVFPTIIRNTRSGQGEPLGFIFAVDHAYDQQFGLHNVEGEPVEMEALNPGVGNIFRAAADLFRLAGRAAADTGATLDLNTTAVAVAAAGSLASGEFTTAEANAFLTELVGEDAPQLPEGSMAQLQGLLPAAKQPIPALEALNLPDATNLLGALNLNTLRAEVDRLLGVVGLQLRQGDVYLSRLGAERLDARTGDLLEIYLGPIPVPYRVAGIVQEAGPLATLSPVVMMDLAEAQRLLAPVMPDRVNVVLVSNKGDAVEGMQHATAVSERLRILALEEGAVEQVAAVLSRPAVLTTLKRQVANESDMLPGDVEDALVSIFGDAYSNVAASTMPNRAQLATLPEVLGRGERGERDRDALRAILSNLGNRTWLLDLPLGASGAAELRAAIDDMTQMEVLDPLSKQSVVSLSGVAGTLFSTIFTIFGIFSIMAAILLIFMIFVMLAAERRSEMGMARGIGMQRSRLVQMFVTEGMLYDLAAALSGVVFGLGISYLMIGFLSGLFNDVSSQFGARELFFQFRYNVSTASIIIAACAGVLFTFVIVSLSSYRVSRLNIVAAIHNLPDGDNRALRNRWQQILYAGLGPALLASGATVIWQYNRQGLTAIQVGVTLALFGANATLSRLLVT
ncbi:MAG: FtsX-like permease family protein, partial [Anaerolineae bacterium]|nr:FtsX-like permease family protein [Anaerolineae bacterium]